MKSLITEEQRTQLPANGEAQSFGAIGPDEVPYGQSRRRVLASCPGRGKQRDVVKKILPRASEALAEERGYSETIR